MKGNELFRQQKPRKTLSVIAVNLSQIDNSVHQKLWQKMCGYLYLTLVSFLQFLLLTADIISTVEFNQSGELLATGDKGGRVVIFQQEQEVCFSDT